MRVVGEEVVVDVDEPHALLGDHRQGRPRDALAGRGHGQAIFVGDEAGLETIAVDPRLEDDEAAADLILAQVVAEVGDPETVFQRGEARAEQERGGPDPGPGGDEAGRGDGEAAA